MKNLSTGKGYGQKIHFLKSLIMKTESVLKTDYAETWGGKIHVHNVQSLQIVRPGRVPVQGKPKS